MSLTRVTYGLKDGKLEIVEMRTGLVDDDPVVYFGNEDLPYTNEELETAPEPVAVGWDNFLKYLEEKEQKPPEKDLETKAEEILSNQGISLKQIYNAILQKIVNNEITKDELQQLIKPY